MLTQAIENLLNRNLPRSPRAQQLCVVLKGKRVRVEATGLGWRLDCESLGSSLQLTRVRGGRARAGRRRRGRTGQSRRAGRSSPEAVIQRGDVRITGDAEIAQQFRELAMLLKPDIEEELSRLIGDTPAHQALRLVSAATGFGRTAMRTGMRNMADYLAHERGDLVPRAEAEDFYRGVERLREDLDRLEARARLLEPNPRSRRPSDEAARPGPAHRNPTRAGAARAGRVRARHASVPAAALPVPASPWTWAVRRREEPRAVRLREALQELGPIFVKFGQALSTRRDLLPADIADELAKLQDRVPPFDGAHRARHHRGGLRQGRRTGVLDLRREAAGGRLHRPGARRRTAPEVPLNGAKTREVVVKVLRPGMHAGDRARPGSAARAGARSRSDNWEGSRRLRPLEVVREYEKTILDELDLMREAGNASQLRRNFEGSSLLYVPAVHWDFCRPQVMVMERIRGVQISNMARLREAGTDIRKLAENGVEIFFTQVFKHNFFHADMHPGNIFVLIDNPAQPKYAAVDFGIVGTLDPRDQYYLAENFLAVFDRDYRRVARCTWNRAGFREGSRVDEMESAIRTVCEPIFNKPLRRSPSAPCCCGCSRSRGASTWRSSRSSSCCRRRCSTSRAWDATCTRTSTSSRPPGPIMREWVREKISGRTLLENARAQIPEILSEPADAGAAGALGRAARPGRTPAARGGRARNQRAAPRDPSHQPAPRQDDHGRRGVVRRHRLAGAGTRAGMGRLVAGRRRRRLADRARCAADYLAGRLPATLHIVGDGMAKSSRWMVARSASICCRVISPAAITSVPICSKFTRIRSAPPLRGEHHAASLGIHVDQSELAETAVEPPAEVTILVAREVLAHRLGGRQRRLEPVDARIRRHRGRVEILDDQPAAGLQRLHHALQRALALDHVQEHQARVDQIEGRAGNGSLAMS